MNRLHSILLIFFLGLFSTPVLDVQAVLEEFVFAQAEDAASPDFISPSPLSSFFAEQADNGPSPNAAGLLFSGSIPAQNELLLYSRELKTDDNHRANRPLFLLYHNLRFGDCPTCPGA